MAFWPTATTIVLEECSFQHLRVQYEFGFRNENVLRVKIGYFHIAMSHKL